MKRWSLALVLAIVLHGLLGAGLAWSWGREISLRDESPQLAVESVELSFAEREDESAAPAEVESAASVAAPPPAVRQVPEPKTRPIPAEALSPAVAELAPVAAELASPMTPPPAVPTPTIPPPAVPTMVTSTLTPPEVQPAEAKSVEASAEAKSVEASAEAKSAEASVESAPSVPAPRTARVEVPPSLSKRELQRIERKYPEAAQRRGEEGMVLLEVRVAVDGSVTAVAIAESSGFEILDQAAAKAVKDARFAPARRDGVVVAGKVRLPISFRLK